MSNLDISKSVLTDIACTTVEGIEGLHVAAATKVNDVLRQQGKSRPKALRVVKTDGQVTVDVGVNVDFGRNLVQLASQAQREVRENIELMTGMKVQAVNVSVVSVCLPKEQA